jgi:hypothetical protein
MPHISLLAATMTALAVTAGAAYADSNYGPVKNGNQCWHSEHRWNSLGYWAPCQPAQGAQAARAGAPANTNANAKNGRRR